MWLKSSDILTHVNNIWGENGHGHFGPADPADPARAYSFAGGGASDLLATFGFDKAENEPCKNSNFLTFLTPDF